MKPQYRPEIDGLRTIAVLSVLIYHAEFLFGSGKFLTGGFLGVDVFFVISGFLITSILIAEVAQTGTVSIVAFYQRRARRLLPSLLLVMLVSLPFAWIYLFPAPLMDYAGSLLSSLFFGSNFYWHFSLQEYGQESGLLKPFLHTWSLAVEEQFYLLYPIALAAICRGSRATTGAFLAVAIVASLWFAHWMSPKDLSFSFYMLPSRLWELLAGGLLAVVLQGRPSLFQNAALRMSMPLFGLLMIGYAMLNTVLDSRHPGSVTLLPVVGTLLVIAFANPSEITTRVLSSRPFVVLGKMSYALYLWHYPVFAFLRLDGLFDAEVNRVFAIIVCIVLSFLTLKIVENPLRSSSRVSGRAFACATLLAAVVVMLCSGLILHKEGFPERFSKLFSSDVKQLTAHRKAYWRDTSLYTEPVNFSEDRTSVQVIGNSWAKDIANALGHLESYEVAFEGMTGHYCKAITLVAVPKWDAKYREASQRCPANRERFKGDFSNTDLVIIGDNRTLSRTNNQQIRKAILRNLDRLRASGYEGPVLIVSNRPTYKKGIYSMVQAYGSSGGGVNAYATQFLVKPLEQRLKQDEDAKSFYRRHGVYYYSLFESLCAEGICSIVNNGAPLYHDAEHLTMEGGAYVAGPLSSYIEQTVLNKKQ